MRPSVSLKAIRQCHSGSILGQCRKAELARTLRKSDTFSRSLHLLPFEQLISWSINDLLDCHHISAISNFSIHSTLHITVFNSNTHLPITMSRGGGTTLYVTGFGHGTRARDLAYEFERYVQYARVVESSTPIPRTSSLIVLAMRNSSR